MQTVPMTTTGAQLLRSELEDLKNKQRPDIIKAIAEARAHGDLKENAEYHAAREKQSFIEGRIGEIESKLSSAQIIDVSSLSNNGTVIFGARVELLHLDNDQRMAVQIVGEDEANPKNAKISLNSPLARALIGKEEGDCVEVLVSGSSIEYEILGISLG